jgi:hypothetical protein
LPLLSSTEGPQPTDQQYHTILSLTQLSFDYCAIVGEKGCTFVERYVTKGVIKKVARPGEGHVEGDGYGKTEDPEFRR